MTQFNLDDTNAGVEGYYDIDGDVLHIHFYGTNHKTDWRTNIIGALWRKNGFHGGWTRDHNTATPFILSLIQEHKPEIVYFTGHSYGAGIAIKAMDTFSSLYNCRATVFGQPGCASLFKKWKMRKLDITSVAVGHDGVALLPLWIVNLWKVGKRVHHKEGKYKGWFRDFFWHHQPVVYQKHTIIKL